MMPIEFLNQRNDSMISHIVLRLLVWSFASATPAWSWSCDYVPEQNRMAIATCILGGISIFCCTWVCMVILAYRKDMYSVRERIILGLMVANVVFSAANTVPVWHQNPDTCYFSVSFIHATWVRGLWFCAKYWIVSYEIMVMGVAVFVLRNGKSLSRIGENICHTACFVVGILTFTIWGLTAITSSIAADTIAQRRDDCRRTGFCINSTTRLYNETRWKEVHDLDHKEYEKVREVRHTLTVFLRAWLFPLLLVVLLWVVARFSYHKLVRQWHGDFSEARVKWSRDFWEASDQYQIDKQHRLLMLQKAVYDDLAAPLEPYVVVFLLFAIPAVVLSTDHCLRITDDHTGFCQVPCEMVLAARSTATALVYLLDPANRTEVSSWYVVLTRLQRRLLMWMIKCVPASLKVSGLKKVSFSHQLEEILTIDSADSSNTWDSVDDLETTSSA
eukprot:m.1075231 g.1075231  ORF g.1075231 m.1075231 type:complete len:445 (+) comp24239_c0_seq1:280-1614(+)